MNETITLGESIEQALLETMEGMAFTDVERVSDGDLGELAESAIWARIEMIEPPAGELVLLVGEEFAVELEEATMGEAGDDLGDRLEVLGEMLNTLAGSWAKLLRPDGAPTALGLPKVGHGDWSEGAEYSFAIFETEDEEKVVLALRR